MLFPNEISKPVEDLPGNFLSRIKPMDKDHKSIIGRIIIPANQKKTVLKEMKNLGIDKGILFADSIDITCDEIKKQFYYRENN